MPEPPGESSEGDEPAESGDSAEPAVTAAGAEEPAAEAAPSLAPRLRTDRKERIAQAEALSARLTALVAATPFALREAEVALRDARLPHDDLAALPPKLARQLREARAALFARAQEAREAEEWSRWGNATAQEELCKRMEALAAQTDLEKAAKELRTLDGRWAEVRIAPRDEATSLRQRYQTARAPIKEKLDAYFAEKAARENENLRLKQELAGKAEALADSTDWMKASEELKALQASWKEIGPAPRKAGDAVWKRFRGACDKFFSRRQDDLKKRKHEWAANMAKKQALCERAEALAASTEWEATAAEVRKLQAEWKTVGPVRRDRSEAIWQRFRTACDAFFDRYKHRDEAERQARLAQREAAVKELETLVAGAGTDPAPRERGRGDPEARDAGAPGHGSRSRGRGGLERTHHRRARARGDRLAGGVQGHGPRSGGGTRAPGEAARPRRVLERPGRAARVRPDRPGPRAPPERGARDQHDGRARRSRGQAARGGGRGEGGPGGVEAAASRFRGTRARPSSIASGPRAIASSAIVRPPRRRAARADGAALPARRRFAPGRPPRGRGRAGVAGRGPGDGTLQGRRAPPDHGRRPARPRPAPARARAPHRRRGGPRAHRAPRARDEGRRPLVPGGRAHPL